ncbi:pilin [Stenotrophomonas maltophilia]|uniref:pilin n=1 Tax=Stenotrophomonas maltophilia TaxID=40324 RepID=UPI003916F231
MHPRSTANAAGHAPRRYRPWAAAGIIGGLTAVYALLLNAPGAGADADRNRLHAATSTLGRAIAAVEASYADGDLTVTDQHLGLPASAAHCAHLRASLPDTGHAVLTCDLHQGRFVRHRVRWQRSPSGQWRCDTHGADVQALPRACLAE